MPVPVALEGIRVAKEPKMRSFCSRELVGWLVISCHAERPEELEYIVGGLGSHTIRSVLRLVWELSVM